MPGSALQASGREGVLGQRWYAELIECMYTFIHNLLGKRQAALSIPSGVGMNAETRCAQRTRGRPAYFREAGKEAQDSAAAVTTQQEAVAPEEAAAPAEPPQVDTWRASSGGKCASIYVLNLV